MSAVELPRSSAIVAFHDACFARADWPASAAPRYGEGAWQAIEQNHRCNHLLWDEEDQARRVDVGPEAIAQNKRAIDGFNQARNDAIERLDEHLVAMLAALRPAFGGEPAARLNSETAGAMTDRLSILALKVRAMRAQTERTDASAEHVASCRAKLARLEEQRADLARCFDALLADCVAGVAYFKIYRQFKMYNDPTLNPYLYKK